MGALTVAVLPPLPRPRRAVEAQGPRGHVGAATGLCPGLAALLEKTPSENVSP